MSRTAHLRPAGTSRLCLILFLLLPFTFLLAPTLIAQGNGGEPPLILSEPPALPLLSLAAAPVTINEFPAPTTPLTVTITNLGTGPAQAISLQMDGGQLTLPISQTLGTLEAGQSLTTILPLELIGYAVGERDLLLTTDAISLTNPVQTVATLTLLEPISNPGSLTNPEQNESISDNQKGDDKGLPEFHLLQVQRPPTTDYRGRVLTFRLTNSQGYDKDLALTLSQWLPGLELSTHSLQLTYLPDGEVSLETDTTPAPENNEPVVIPFTYDNSLNQLTFVPQGDGQYALATAGNLSESLDGSAPTDPQGWVPTFNAPTTSLFTGSAAYQYPLLTPPGPGLFQPTLALSYSGAAGNGVSHKPQADAMGFGWNLAGSIEVSQAVTICPWGGGTLVCPANAYWEGTSGYPGLIELTLSLGGTGYELTHIGGNTQNGYPGRYTLKGNTSLYVEYCGYTSPPTAPTALCLSAESMGDNSDSDPTDGAATDTTSKGYWVIKDSQNTLYRLGYTTNAEQELINMDTGPEMGPWEDANAPGHALRWRVDQVNDRFSNETSYDYYEYLPSQNNLTWSDNQVHAKASYLHTITYGHNQIVFHYAGRGDDMGIPPYDWIFHPHVVSWQTHLLSRIEVKAKDYETGSGNYNLVRAYQFNYLIERHGNANNPNVGITNQTDWCKAQDTASWGWKLALLTAITELDANGQAKVRVEVPGQLGVYSEKADVEFVYWWYKTGEYTDSYINFRYCAPYLTELRTPYRPGNPVATFTYQQASHDYHAYNKPNNTDTWINTITSQILNNGWTTDAPPQVTNFTYALNSGHYGGKARTEHWGSYPGAFQGFQEVTRIVMNGNAPHLKEVNHFLAYNFDHDWTSLTGSMDWQEVRTSDDKTITRTEEVWQADSVAIPLTSNPIRYTYLPRRLSTVHYTTYYPSNIPYYDPADNLGTRTNYTYDDYNNVVEVREYGTDVGATSAPYRVQETLYAHNTSPTNWLIGLPWRVTVWDGLPNNNDPSKIISRQRTRYDGAECTAASTQVPTSGLVTATDTYNPGLGNGICFGGTGGADFLTTRMVYGENGDLPWQLTRTISPRGVYPGNDTQEQLIYWRNHSTIEKIRDLFSGDETVYGFNDTHTPWLFTDKTAPNGANTRYEYDTFGRLINQYTPDYFTGLATVWSQQIIYKDNAPWGGDYGTDPAMPLYIDTITVPGETYSATSRTYYDALGRARQQFSWNLASDFDKVVTDTEYNSLGQVICQTTPIPVSYSAFNSGLNCATQDHTTTSYTRSGSPASTIGIDGLTSYATTLGQTSLNIDPAGHFRAQNQDPYGQLASVVEYNIQHNAFATSNGAFNTDPAQWQLQNATATTLGGEQVLQMNGTAWGPYNLLRSSYSLDPTSQEGVSAFFRFRLSNNNHQGRMGLLTNQGGFIGLMFYQGHLYPDYNMNQGDQSHMGVRILQQANVWYRAQMSITAQGLVSWRVWQENAPGDPDKQFTWKLDTTASKAFYSAATYKFFSHVGGTVYLGGYQEGPSYVTQYSYDKANNLTQVRDSQGNLTTLTYDKLGRKLTMNDPDMGSWSYAYDLAGNLIRQTDANQQRLCFYYDELNRLSSKYHNGSGSTACPPAPGGSWLASYYYHWSGMGRGQLKSIYGLNNNLGYYEEFTYDYRGRVTETERTIAGTPYILSTTYDLLDRPLALTYPGDEVVTTTYDKQVADRLETSALGPDLVSNVTYNHRMEMTGMVLGNNLTQSYVYFSATESYRLDKTLLKVNGGSNIYYREYEYDNVGNITQFITSVAGQVQEEQFFTYDSLGRLKTAKAVGGPAQYDHTSLSTDYDYNAIGNIVSLAGSSTYTYTGWPSGCTPTYPAPTQALPHAVKQKGSDYYCYDKNGNMTKRVEGGTTYTQAFDVENRLITVSKSGTNPVTKFAYDASGQRLRTEVAPAGSPVANDTRTFTTYPFPGYEVEQTDTWLYLCADRGGNCSWQWGHTSTVTRKTYFLGGQAIATHISGDPISTNNGFFYLHSDHLGSTSLLTNSSGVKVTGSETRYYPYGAHRLIPSQTITDRNFTGQKENLELGLIYYNARYYVPSLARFASADTIVPDPNSPQQFNRYTYTLNNPVRYVDSTGHCTEPITFVACMVIATIGVYIVDGLSGSDVDYSETTDVNFAYLSVDRQIGPVIFSDGTAFHYPSGQAQEMSCNSVCLSNPSLGVAGSLSIGSTDFTSVNDTPADAWGGYSLAAGLNLSAGFRSGAVGTSTTYCPDGCDTANTKATTVNTYSLGASASIPIPVSPYLCESYCTATGNPYPMQDSPFFPAVDGAIRLIQNSTQDNEPFVFIRAAGH